MISDKISEWFYQYNKDIYHFLVYYVGSGDIEDLVQEVFIRAIKGFDTYQSKASVKTWLFSIARNVGIDEIRKRQRNRIKSVINFSDSEPKEETTPELILHMNENNRILYQVINSLKDNYRDVIILRAIKELSVSETADILNWNENKVRITYHRALKALKEKKEVIQYER
ncbi:RNA polymerase sigma factor [Ornithinibacillus halophilus]|uniref:RNA polymerase sigma factor n=1 Tax=Ornithinibacillus halophilus TaxID=930117 RepID=A0A1M5NGJ0_9BACI|nr:RNA polymerase sigma factor [Ornithinibacillus halophilus]SHG88612.1 RNA polymerase sigma-70 factor, ECF subfamily [Ornithinibacillus halophilus]